MGFASEQATIESEEPLRADGLTAALKQALDEAGLALADMGYRIGTLTASTTSSRRSASPPARLLRGRTCSGFLAPGRRLRSTGGAAISV